MDSIMFGPYGQGTQKLAVFDTVVIRINPLLDAIYANDKGGVENAIIVENWSRFGDNQDLQFKYHVAQFNWIWTYYLKPINKIEGEMHIKSDAKALFDELQSAESSESELPAFTEMDGPLGDRRRETMAKFPLSHETLADFGKLGDSEQTIVLTQLVEREAAKMKFADLLSDKDTSQWMDEAKTRCDKLIPRGMPIDETVQWMLDDEEVKKMFEKQKGESEQILQRDLMRLKLLQSQKPLPDRETPDKEPSVLPFVPNAGFQHLMNEESADFKIKFENALKSQSEPAEVQLAEAQAQPAEAQPAESLAK
eukprot:Platyproteum_vivax@DN6550_c0_g1_i2.p1